MVSSASTIAGATAAGQSPVQAGGDFVSGSQLRVLMVIWLIVCTFKIFTALPDLTDRQFPDPDDAMRLLQVRDWMAGQSWFDVTQYRLNPPFGGPMHWSRLLDLPIAAIILLLRPLLGQHGAETAALISVPMLTLGSAMLLVQRITLKVADSRAALLAVIATPASLGAMTQMRVMRIDHHGWQIVLALSVVLAALDRRAWRSGLLAGAAMGLWLNVSIEGLPFAVATAALFAFQWLADRHAADRLRTYLASLAATATALFVVTHWPSTWLTLHQDSLNYAHLTTLAVAAVCCLLAVRPSTADVRVRAATLAAAGLIAGATMFTADPHFLKPFDWLDPLVQRMWYNAVDEGQPVWRLSVYDAAVALAQPVVGLAGTAFALWKAPAEQRALWLRYGFLLVAGTLSAVAVTREATAASLLALPGTAFAAGFALSRARGVPNMPKRVLATFGAFCIIAPAYIVPAAAMPHDRTTDSQPDFGARCTHESELVHLNALPPSTLASPLDITPAILASTRHRAIGSGHHRNVAGIKDMILLYTGPPAVQHEVIARRRIDYVVLCPGTAEANWWSKNGPGGLASLLSRNDAPAWLEPVRVPGLDYLQVWRVRRTAPRAAGHS